MTHIMIDTETLGTAPGCVITTIGAVAFNLQYGEQPAFEISDNQFYCRVERHSCRNIKMFEDADTVAWWRKQSSMAQGEIFDNPNRIPIRNALENLNSFCKGYGDDIEVWSHGAGFDIPIIEWPMRQLEIKPAWKYYNVRDTRTIYMLAGFKYRDSRIPQPSLPHHALEDAIAQVIAVRNAFKVLVNA